jgi:hypothetical protein
MCGGSLTRRTCMLLFELLLVVVLLPKVSRQRVLLVVGVQLHTRRLGLRGQRNRARDLAAVSVCHLPPRTQKALLDLLPPAFHGKGGSLGSVSIWQVGRASPAGQHESRPSLPPAPCASLAHQEAIQNPAGSPSPATSRRPPLPTLSHGTCHFFEHLGPKLTNFPREAPRLSPAPLAAEAAPPILQERSPTPPLENRKMVASRVWEVMGLRCFEAKNQSSSKAKNMRGCSFCFGIEKRKI